MGGLHSSPLHVRQQRPKFGPRSPFSYKSEPNNNNNYSLKSVTPDSGYYEHHVTRSKHSILSQGWTAAKRTANAILPNSSSSTSTTGSSFRTKSSNKSLSSYRSQSSFTSDALSPVDVNCNYFVPNDDNVTQRSNPMSRSSTSSAIDRIFSNSKKQPKYTVTDCERQKGIKQYAELSQHKLDWDASFKKLFNKVKKATNKRTTSMSPSSSSASTSSFTESPNEQIKHQPALSHSYSFFSQFGDNVDQFHHFDKSNVIFSSTPDLLLGLGRYVAENCSVIQFEPAQLVMWLRSIDRTLMLQGWQDIAFVNPANLVFVFFLIKEQLSKEYNYIHSTAELQSMVRTCLYVSYSYLGNEISYPLKPFISASEDRKAFWNRCVSIINENSEDMLQLNLSTHFFFDVFNELRTYACLSIY